MRVIVAIDKFKGSCSGAEAAKAVIAGIHEVQPGTKALFFPIADGGEGFSEALKHYRHTRTIRIRTIDPLGNPITAAYEWDERKKSAIIELAAASGWALLSEGQRNPLLTSTRGTGRMIVHAINKGAKKIILGLGGSATNDGGMGIAYELGFECLDGNGKRLEPVGASLLHIRKIIPPQQLPGVVFEIGCDVNNPLYGKQGAARVYGPQKGANQKSVLLLDKGLQQLSKQITKATAVNPARVKGMGAAGGAMVFLFAYFNCSIHKGADMVVRESRIIAALKKADLLITGEGRMDEQSLRGKVVSRLIGIAREHEVAVLLVCGQWVRNSEVKRQLKDIPVLELMQYARSQKESIRKVLPLLKKHTATYFRNYGTSGVANHQA